MTTRHTGPSTARTTFRTTSRCVLALALAGCSADGASPGAAVPASGSAEDGSMDAPASFSTSDASRTEGGLGLVTFDAGPGMVQSVDDASSGPIADVDAAAPLGPIDASGDTSLVVAPPADAGRLAEPDAALPPVKPPVPDTSSPVPISAVGSGAKVEGNLPYGSLPMQRLDVIYPSGGSAGPGGTGPLLPGVIMFHGGGWIHPDKATMSSFYNRYLAHGFVVCNVEYRVADGTANGGIAPAAVQDALLAAKWFWDHLDYYRVDKSRYVVTGASAGGHLALMVGLATPAAQLGPTNPTDYRIAAIVNGYGPSDVPDLLQRNIGWAIQWLPANTPNHDALAKQVSPITYVRASIPPLITVQGSLDSTVPVVQSQRLTDLLKAAGADASIHLVTGAGHGFATPATAWPDAEAAMFGFLSTHGI